MAKKSSRKDFVDRIDSKLEKKRNKKPSGEFDPKYDPSRKNKKYYENYASYSD